MARNTKKAEIEAQRKRIEKAYYAKCQGIQISVMDMGKIFDKGHELIAAGVDETGLQDGIRAFVETIRCN